MTDRRLRDFAYPGEMEPAGVIELSMSHEVVTIIEANADLVRLNLDAFPARRKDCRHACGSWQRVLMLHRVAVKTAGGEGVDDGDYSSDYRFVPLDRRSGYRVALDDLVHRHYWLEIGPERLIFDPTAHQFDEKGGVSLDRYTLDGKPVLVSRAR